MLAWTNCLTSCEVVCDLRYHNNYLMPLLEWRVHSYPHPNPHIDGILPKGPYPPCLRMADRALLAGYPRYINIADNLVDVEIEEEVHKIHGLTASNYYLNGCWWCHDMKMLFALPPISEVTGEFPLRSASNAEFWRPLCCNPEQNVEKKSIHRWFVWAWLSFNVTVMVW